MTESKSTLLREKFIIHDLSADSAAAPLVALSNRFVLHLKRPSGEIVETLIVRAQNMHSCMRFAMQLGRKYETGGPIIKRARSFQWDKAWEAAVSDYEHRFNPYLWAAVYGNGQLLFEIGEHHPFLDVIEKCDHTNPDDYDFSVPLAEQAFQKTGKSVKIEHDSNVALSVHFEDDHGRCGIILRGPMGTKTFTYSAHPKPNRSLIQYEYLMTGAAFLEGVQLCFMIGTNTEKQNRGMIEEKSKEDKQTKEARRRVARLRTEIANFENAYKVRYRPEKPDFAQIQREAEDLTARTLDKTKGDIGRAIESAKVRPRTKSAKNDD